MDARERLNQLKEKFGPAILRADLPNDSRLFVYVDPSALKAVCRYVFRDLDARYVISIGVDDRPFSGNFLVFHDFAFDKDKILVQHHHLCCRRTIRRWTASPTSSPAPTGPSARSATWSASSRWATHTRSGWCCPTAGPTDSIRCARTCTGTTCPKDYDENREFKFDETPPGLHRRAVRAVPSDA